MKGILDKGSDENEIKLLCISLERFSTTIQFIILSLAVFIFYLSYGYILELIFTLEGMAPHGWFLTLVQFAFYSIFAFLQLLTSRKKVERKIPLETYFLIALLTVGTMGFSNTSMGYLNYPTQVIFKSCKLIPVMVGSVVLLKKRYTGVQVAASLCMTAGLAWFTLADTAVQPSFHPKGVMLISLALLCDAVIGNVQEGAMRTHKESPLLVVLYSYFFGFLMILVALLASGTLGAALGFALKHPWEVFGRCTALSAAGFCGVQVVLLLISRFGAVVAVAVTTCRKAVSIALSFLFFAKPFTVHYLYGGGLVALGVYLSAVGKGDSGGAGTLSSLLVALQKGLLRVSRAWNSSRRVPFMGDKTPLVV